MWLIPRSRYDAGDRSVAMRTWLLLFTIAKIFRVAAWTSADYTATFQATGCLNDDPHTAWWETQTDAIAIQDMYSYCSKTDQGTASVDQQAQCCGVAGTCNVTCTLQAAMTVATPVPTPVPTLGGASGDPITYKNGQLIRFDIPEQTVALMIKVAGLEVFARADLVSKASKSQWLSQIILRNNGFDVLRIIRRNLIADLRSGRHCPYPSRLQCNWTKAHSCGLDNSGTTKRMAGKGWKNRTECEAQCVSIAAMAMSIVKRCDPIPGCCWYRGSDGLCIYGEGAVYNKGEPEISAASCALVQPSVSRSITPDFATQTMYVTILESAKEYNMTKSTSAIVESGSVNVSVENTGGWIGSIRKEKVTVVTESLSFQVSADKVHKKMKDQDDIFRFTHLDLSILQVDRHLCRGLLPELWGWLPMSAKTAAMVKSGKMAKGETSSILGPTARIMESRTSGLAVDSTSIDGLGI